MRMLFVLCLFPLAALSQQGVAQPSFDVASIRPGDPTTQSGRLHTEPGALQAENITLRTLIQFAYGIASYQISAPGWIDDTAFTITAKAADRTADDDTLKLMLRTLLADRFGMKTHREQKQLPVFFLALAKNGPKIHESATPNGSKFVESKTEGAALFSENKGTLIVARATMAEFVAKLAGPLRQPVVDRTGLKGRYDLQIDMTPYLTPSGGDGGPNIADPVSFVATAFQDQLGLKLESGKEMTDLLVVDAISRTPSEN